MIRELKEILREDVREQVLTEKMNYDSISSAFET